MRYAVGDEYARDLGVDFYRGLLAHTRRKSAAAALSGARKKLGADPNAAGRYHVCDHATPVLYGAARSRLEPPAGRSPALDTRDPRLHRVAELTAAEHRHFVGRTWQLAGLGSDFIGAKAGDEVKPVAVVTGLGGMGKTALAAEALSLWASRFEWVLLYQAKPNALGFDAFLRDVHMKLNEELGRYHHHVKSRPADAIHRAPEEGFTGPERFERLTRNLLSALRDEPILLVLDNFETNLKPDAEPVDEAAEPAWVCEDPAWDRCLARLAAELIGTPSRVLVTCRRPLAALPSTAAHRVLLGPLPPGEAALYLREHDELSKLTFSGDGGEKAVALRLLQASRFYPLLMNRLARLATGGPDLRPQLLSALETLEKRHDTENLPELFAAGAVDGKELAYLDDALATSLDGLIAGASPDARRLLWMIAVANEPVTLSLLESAWSGESHVNERLRRLRRMLDTSPMLPRKVQELLNTMTPEQRTILKSIPPEAPARPDLVALLQQLALLGLVMEERASPGDDNPDLTCHELVRERVRAWMEVHPRDRAGLTERAIHLAYAERFEVAFKSLLHKNMTAALEAGRRALVYCVQAEAWDRLHSFASELVTSAQNPRLLEDLLPYLEAAANAAPEGRRRWRCLGYLADALWRSNRPDASLPFYEQAATQARNVAEGKNDGSREAWSDLAAITANWASALGATGAPSASRKRQFESIEASKAAESPAINIVSRKLEALRSDIMQGKVASALPRVEAHLSQVEGWWQQHNAGESVAAAPDREVLARVLIGVLDVAKAAHVAQEAWGSALGRADRILEIMRIIGRPPEEVGAARMNRANVLGRMSRFGEAKAELEACLPICENHPTCRARIFCSLADLFNQQGDTQQAIALERRALALRVQLPNPQERAMSHNNLGEYLERRGRQSDLTESPRHLLAALVYRFVAGPGQHVQTSLHNYAVRFHRAQSGGGPLTVPRLTELLTDPAFHPLVDFLRKRRVDVTVEQAVVDHFLKKAKERAAQSAQAG